MHKNTQMLLGLTVVGVGGYLLWKSGQKKTSFVGDSVKRRQRHLAGNSSKNATGTNTTKVVSSSWSKGASLENRPAAAKVPPFFDTASSKWN